jgi:hypothetical protein
MLTDQQIADYYSWLYTSLPVPPNTWDHLLAIDGAYTGIKTIDGVHYVMFRGSATFMDWMDDFSHMAVPYDDFVLGPVHPGFRSGVMAVKTQIDWICGDQNPLVIVGHSLGAGHASLCAGYRLAAGKRVDAVVMFGEPRAGADKLAGILAKTTIRSYRNGDANGHDLVTDVPYAIPPVLDYRHPVPLDSVSESPPANDAWSIFKYHHFFLYAKALGATGPAALSLQA